MSILIAKKCMTKYRQDLVAKNIRPQLVLCPHCDHEIYTCIFSETERAQVWKSFCCLFYKYAPKKTMGVELEYILKKDPLNLLGGE
jgi:hypothetical protein